MYPSRIEELVGELKRAYPHLPDYIPAELEEEHLATLEPWLERVRYFWGETAEEEDPVLALANEHRTLDKGQMGPVLCALDERPMTPEARRAWNELFVMSSALMGQFAGDYYHRYCTSSIMSIDDVWQMTPIAFLYALSAFEPDGNRGTPRSTWLGPGDPPERKRPRLLTWIHVESQRHIRRYLQFYAHSIRQGSGHTQRLRSIAIRALQLAIAEGDDTDPRSVAKRLRRDPSNKSEMKAAQKLEEEGYNFLYPVDVEELDRPFSADHSVRDSYVTLAEVVESREPDAEGLFDPIAYLRHRTKDLDVLRAAHKLMNTEIPLTETELDALGL